MHASEKVRKAGGFTLIELAVVVAVLVVALGIVPFYISRTSHSAELSASARELAASIRYARALALEHAEPQTVSIDIEDGAYELRGRGRKTLPEGVRIKVVEPLSGEVSDDVWSLRIDEAGRMHGGKIVLYTERRSVSVYIDPVAGAGLVTER